MTHDPVILLMLAAIFMLVWWVVYLAKENRSMRKHVESIEGDLREVQELLALK